MPSLFSPIIERSGAAKFYEPVFDDFKPERIRSAEIEARSGRQEQLHNLYQVMMQAWPELQCDVLNMAAQPSRCRWSVVPGTLDGGVPSPRAKEAAETVSRALWSPPHLPTGDVRMSFSELLGSLFYGLCFGVSAYEIEWERTPDDLIVPARYLRLLPQYYGWSSRNDEPDSLLLYPGGTWGTDGKPFPRHKFLVALNRRGPSHPWQNGSFHALLAHFCAYKWGWSWLMSYCQKYGQPIRTFYAYSDKEQQDIQKQLTEKGAVTDIVVRRNGANAAPAMEMMTAGHAAGSIPHEALIERANAACHQLIRGQSMTNEIGRNGSRAQAEVGNDVRLEEVEHVCNYVADIISSQLIPSILELNYGPRHNIPMPELRFEVPGARMNAAALDTYMKARQLGLAIKLSEVYENCGIAQPAEGDEVLEPLEGNPADELFPDEVQAALALDRRRIWKGKEAARRQAENLAPKARQDWMRPFRARLTQMLEEGKTAQDILDAIRSGELSPDTEALSEALHATLLAGFGAGQQESVAAAAKDPAERIRIARLAAEARWRGHVKRNDIAQARKAIRTLTGKMRELPPGYKPDNQNPIPYLAVSEKTRSKVQAEIGIDVSDYKHYATEEMVRHMVKQHPDLTDEEIAHIPDVLNDWHDLIVINRKKGKTLKYTKTYGNNTYILVERMGSLKDGAVKKQLNFISFHKKTS